MTSPRLDLIHLNDTSRNSLPAPSIVGRFECTNTLNADLENMRLSLWQVSSAWVHGPLPFSPQTVRCNSELQQISLIDACFCSKENSNFRQAVRVATVAMRSGS